MQGAALIVQIECTVMVVGIRVRDGRLRMCMCMGCDRHGFIDIQRMIMEQRHHAGYLREREQRQQRCAKPTNCSHERHRIRSRFILSQAERSECDRDATLENHLVERA